MDEKGLTNTIDQLGGSYCVKRMAGDFENEVKNLFSQIGDGKAIKSCLLSKMI